MAKCLLVSIVDDDESVREALPDLLKGTRLFRSSIFVG
jgi:FixJ family two-component response regulator